MRSSRQCPECRGAMQERLFRGYPDMLLYGLLYAGVAAGVALAFYAPVAGWVIGPVVIVLALWCGLRVRGARVCRQCGYREVFRHFGQD